MRLAIIFLLLQLWITGLQAFVVYPTRNTNHAPQGRFFHDTLTLTCVGPVARSRVVYKKSATTDENEFVEADDLESLQILFNKYCDKEGLMTKTTVASIPAIAELMKAGDLLMAEFDDIWDKAPKFPEVNKVSEERIDVDSFVQIYRDIDDLFEDLDDEEPTVQSVAAASESAATPSVQEDDDPEDGEIEAELEIVFKSICDKDGYISKETLRQWDEVQKLVDDGLLGIDEFDDLWEKTKKSPGQNGSIDLDGFLSFNVALDGLFEFEDEEEEIDIDGSDTSLIQGDDLPPGVLFSYLANSNGLVGQKELKRWAELQEMLADGDLLQSEVDEIYNRVAKSKEDATLLDVEGFTALCEAIDELFIDEEEEQQQVVSTSSSSNSVGTTQPQSRRSLSPELKAELFDALDDLNSDDERLPCGLDATEEEQKEILSLADALERQESNIVRQKRGAIEPSDLAGTWELIYTSSSAMKFNKGLSGLGGSFPNGRFGGLKQALKASKFMTDVEYVERIEVTPSAASFDVTVNGDWDLRSSVSLFTGEPSVVLTVTPDRVNYGPTSTKADHWKSLGPMNMLDVTYLDDDIRIMRGNTSVETVFIFRRTS